MADRGNISTRRSDRAWGRFANELGITFNIGTQNRWVSGMYKDHGVCLDICFKKRGPVLTRVSLSMVRNRGGRLELFRETLMAKLAKFMEFLVDVELGDVEFDPGYVVCCADPLVPARAIQSVTRARLLKLRRWRFTWYAREAWAVRRGYEHDPQRLMEVFRILLEVAQELESYDS